MAREFMIKKGTPGKVRFNLLARNGQVVATSEAYGSKAAAMGGSAQSRAWPAAATIEDQTTEEWSAPEAARKAAASAKKLTAPVVAKTAKRSSFGKST